VDVVFSAVGTRARLEGQGMDVMVEAHINGSAVCGPIRLLRGATVAGEAGVALASAGGLAVGRLFPDLRYLMDLDTLRNDAASYFEGDFARLRLWTGGSPPSDSKPYASCSETAANSIGDNDGGSRANLTACFDFNGTLGTISAAVTLKFDLVTASGRGARRSMTRATYSTSH
jgi:hypothetical protein